MYVCTYIHMYTHIYIYIYICVYVCTYIYKYDINMCICVYANIAYKNILTNECNVYKKIYTLTNECNLFHDSEMLQQNMCESACVRVL